MARVSFAPLEYLDAEAKRDLAKVGPIDLYIKHDQAWTLGGFKVLRGQKRIGSMALRSETRPDGLKVLVIVAASVRDNRSVLLEGLKQIKLMAEANGFQFIRAHTDRVRVIEAFLDMGGVAILNFATRQEYRSTDLKHIQDYISTAGETVVWLPMDRAVDRAMEVTDG